jgi:hypothetical protein
VSCVIAVPIIDGIRTTSSGSSTGQPRARRWAADDGTVLGCLLRVEDRAEGEVDSLHGLGVDHAEAFCESGLGDGDLAGRSFRLRRHRRKTGCRHRMRLSE